MTEREWLRAALYLSTMSMEDLSVEMGRARGYLRDYMHRGSPEKLDGDDRAKIALLLGAPPFNPDIKFTNTNDDLTHPQCVEDEADEQAMRDMLRHVYEARVLANRLGMKIKLTIIKPKP